MANQIDLASYLARQGAEGELDSQGDFTVSHNDAVRKLARFALPRPSAWVSKLVQAAVRLKCSSLDLGQSRNDTIFHFVFAKPEQVPNEAEILGALVSAGLTGPGALDALGLALRGLVEQARLSFLLICASSGEAQSQRIYAGPYYSSLSEGQRMAAGQAMADALVLLVRHQPGDTGLRANVAAQKHTRAIVEELETYAYMAPTSISLNGKALPGPLNCAEVGYSRRHLPLLTSGLNELAHSPARMPLPPGFEEKFLSVNSHPLRVLRYYGGRKGFAAAYLLTFRFSLAGNEAYRRSRLLWLLDGIVVDEEEIGPRDSLELRIFANAKGLKTDLTGFRLVDDPDYRQRRLEILHRMVGALGDTNLLGTNFFREDRDESSPYDDKVDKHELDRKIASVGFTSFSAGAALFFLSMPVPAAIMVLGSVFGAKKVAGIALAHTPPDRAKYEETLFRKLASLREILEKTITMSKARGWSKDQSGRPGEIDS